MATRLRLEFYSEAKQDDGEVSGLKTIDMPRLDQHQGSEHELFCRLVTEYHVPESLRYRVSCQYCSTLATRSCLRMSCNKWHLLLAFCTQNYNRSQLYHPVSPTCVPECVLGVSTTMFEAARLICRGLLQIHSADKDQDSAGLRQPARAQAPSPHPPPCILCLVPISAQP